jgi:tetratricopeptide (TPR) repeat protein
MCSAFYGRQQELAWLRQQFESCGSAGPERGPRMVFLVAESGLGKSRLVQELYFALASDPRWDPPDVDYWPDAFATTGDVLRITPDMKGHKAQGPPRFIWLGARCVSTEGRNGHPERSILPAIRSSMMVHAEIVRACQPIWSEGARRLAAAFKTETAGEAMEQAADYVAAAVAQLPCGGLVAKLAIGGLKLAYARYRGPGAYEDILQKHTASDKDELLECFRLLFNADATVPVILCVDDAQWIDPDALLFLKELWAEAKRRMWPLLVVVTHWEREWREMALADVSGSLHHFRAYDTVHVLQITSATDAALTACVRGNLSGLTEAQVLLMVEKAAGNFLQLYENIGQLVAEPMNFENERLDGPLTADAVEYVKQFESDREKRIRQRFQAFESDVKKILGWSSQLGTRFLSEVINTFAVEHLGRSDAGELIARCIDPYIVLQNASPLTREFRDKVFHRVADEFRHRYLLKDQATLSTILRVHLIEWLGTGVTADGRLIEVGTATDGGRTLAALPAEERRDLLGFALSALELPSSPNWSMPEHKAALWATCLAIDSDSRDALWGRVRLHLERLKDVRWERVPMSICGVEIREGIVIAAISCGLLQLALDIALTVLQVARHAIDGNRAVENLVIYGDALQLSGDIARSLGQLSDALGHQQEAYEIRKEVLAAIPTPASKRSVVESLNRIGDLEEACGRTPDALRTFEMMLGMTVELEAEDGRNINLLDRSVAISRIGDVMHKQGRLQEAVLRYEKALSIRRALQEQVGGPLILEYLSNSLERIGDIEFSLSQNELALLRFQESLEIRRRLLADEDLPARRRTVVASLNRIGDLHKESGRLAEARQHYEEMLKLLSDLSTEDVTPQRLRDISVCLGRIAEVAEEAGQAADALSYYEGALLAAKQLLETEEPFDACFSVVWLSHRMAALLASDDVFAAMGFMNEQMSFVNRLEESCGENYDYLLKCAEFWNTRAAVSEAVGDMKQCVSAQERVAILLDRLRAMD